MHGENLATNSSRQVLSVNPDSLLPSLHSLSGKKSLLTAPLSERASTLDPQKIFLYFLIHMFT